MTPAVATPVAGNDATRTLLASLPRGVGRIEIVHALHDGRHSVEIVSWPDNGRAYTIRIPEYELPELLAAVYACMARVREARGITGIERVNHTGRGPARPGVPRGRAAP